MLRRQPDHARVRMRVGFRSRTGWEPIRVAKENQDCVVALVPWGPQSEFSLMAVLDGHGRYGHHCSIFIAQRIEAFLRRVLNPFREGEQLVANALYRAIMYAESRLEAPPHTFDYSLSGSTATIVLLQGATLYCANVGDSRAVLGRLTCDECASAISDQRDQNNITEARRRATLGTCCGERDPTYVAIPITVDQKPSRPDEMLRLRQSGARVDSWEGVDVGEIRVWRPDIRSPGLAVSRSFGDLEVKRYGVTCDPEIFALRLHKHDEILILGSDGIFEFLSNEQVVRDVAAWKHAGIVAQEAAERLVRVATDKWIEDDSIIDDISCIVVFLDVLSPAALLQPDEPRMLSVSPASTHIGSFVSSKASAAVESGVAEHTAGRVAMSTELDAPSSPMRPVSPILSSSQVQREPPQPQPPPLQQQQQQQQDQQQEQQQQQQQRQQVTHGASAQSVHPDMSTFAGEADATDMNVAEFDDVLEIV